MIYKTIDENDVLNARTYIPIMEKEKFLSEAAEACFDKLAIQTVKDGSDAESVPPMFKENTALKSRFMMGALVSLYLCQPIEPVEGTKYLLSADDYDRWAGGHILNQLERMKQNGGAVRDKVFDLIQDYKDLEKRLNTEVYGLAQVMNDPCNRLMIMLRQGITPEAMQKATEELNKVKEELTDYAEKEKKAAVKKNG